MLVSGEMSCRVSLVGKIFYLILAHDGRVLLSLSGGSIFLLDVYFIE